jgi:rubredoxin
MSRTCPDCEGLKNGSRSLEDPHEYLVPAGRSKTGGAVFYKCLLCNTFLTYVPEEGTPRWNAGFQPQDVRAFGRPSAN